MSNIIKQFKKVIALAFFVGALPFIFCTHAYAEEAANSQEPKAKSQWLDDYKKPVGFTYGVIATYQTAYLWRGFYTGAMNVQVDANIGYGGLFAEMWWNIGSKNWKFDQFLPEVDVMLGFDRWGVKLYMLYVHNFNCGFFDFANYADKGNRLELNFRYTVSSKIPQALPYDMSLYGAIGMSPWKSCYSGFEGNFIVKNVELMLRKDWSLSEHCGLALFGQLVIDPYALSKDKSTAEWRSYDPGRQSINANTGIRVYLK